MEKFHLVRNKYTCQSIFNDEVILVFCLYQEKLDLKRQQKIWSTMSG